MKNIKSGNTLEERLEYHSMPEPNSGCQIWLGSVNYQGYGSIGVGRRKIQRVHRVAWELKNGPIPPKMFVCHQCDNPFCINPDHLFVGTASENTRDMYRKGRGPRGNSRLKPKDVEAIRNSDKRQSVLAETYGVSVSMVSRIQNGSRHCGSLTPDR